MAPGETTQTQPQKFAYVWTRLKLDEKGRWVGLVPASAVKMDFKRGVTIQYIFDGEGKNIVEAKEHPVKMNVLLNWTPCRIVIAKTAMNILHYLDHLNIGLDLFGIGRSFRLVTKEPLTTLLKEKNSIVEGIARMRKFAKPLHSKHPEALHIEVLPPKKPIDKPKKVLLLTVCYPWDYPYGDILHPLVVHGGSVVTSVDTARSRTRAYERVYVIEVRKLPCYILSYSWKKKNVSVALHKFDGKELRELYYGSCRSHAFGIAWYGYPWGVEPDVRLERFYNERLKALLEQEKEDEAVELLRKFVTGC